MNSNHFLRISLNSKQCRYVLFGLGLLCSNILDASQLVIVANAKSPVSKLSYEQATALFLGKVFNVSGGGNVVLVDQSESNNLRDQFYLTLTGKKVVQVKGIWMRLVFSGKGVPPTEVANTEEVKKFLQKNVDALGYIEKSAVDDSVKVLLTLE